MYTVVTLAKLAGVSADTIRYYVKLGLLHPNRNKENNYRFFSEDDIKRLQFICSAKQLGFTLHEIKQLFVDAYQKKKSTCPKVREIIERRIIENRTKIKELLALQKRMETAFAQWQKLSNGLPDSQTVCHLIEGMSLVKAPHIR